MKLTGGALAVNCVLCPRESDCVLCPRESRSSIQILDPLQQRIDLCGLPSNDIRLRQDQRDQIILGKLDKRVAIHRILESRDETHVNHIYGIAPADDTKPALPWQG